MSSANGTAPVSLVRPTRLPPEGREIDAEAAQRAAADLLSALGADLSDDGVRDTPRRMVEAYSELLTPEPFRATPRRPRRKFRGSPVANTMSGCTRPHVRQLPRRTDT